MLAVDWKCWKSILNKASAKSITIQMLGGVAALRELFRAKAGNGSHEYLSGEMTLDIGVPLNEKEEIKTEVGFKSTQNEKDKEAPKQPSWTSTDRKSVV